MHSVVCGRGEYPAPEGDPDGLRGGGLLPDRFKVPKQGRSKHVAFQALPVYVFVMYFRGELVARIEAFRRHSHLGVDCSSSSLACHFITPYTLILFSQRCSIDMHAFSVQEADAPVTRKPGI